MQGELVVIEGTRCPDDTLKALYCLRLDRLLAN